MTPLAETPHARSTDPDTSHEAAASINITAQALKILHSYKDGTPILDHEAYRLAGFPPNARDGQRCSDLRQVGLIERTGERALTPSGKNAYLCCITPAGTEYLNGGHHRPEPPVPTSPRAIQNFLLYQPDLPPIEFRGADPKHLHEFIYAAGDHELLVKTTPRTHQLEGLAFALWAKRALLFYEMRTGKTKIALDWLSYLIYSSQLPGTALIIAHAPIGADVWQSQTPLHSFLDIRVVRSGPDSTDEFIEAIRSDRFHAVVVSWSTLQQIFGVPGIVRRGARKGQEKLYANRPLLREVATHLDAIVIDEIHMAGHHDTLRFNIASELAAPCRWRLGLTGTPFGRDPMLLWAQAFLIDDGEALSRSFFFFREAFGVLKYHHFKASKTDFVFDKKKLPLLRDKMRAMSLYCELREIQDVNVLSGTVRLSMSVEQRAAYEETVERLVELRIGNMTAIENLFHRLRQIASGYVTFHNDAGDERILDFDDAGKFIWLEDLVSELPDLQVIIFHEYIHTGRRICSLLEKHKIKHEWLYGGSKNRSALVQRFQTKSSQFLVANAATGGMSIDLSAAEYLIFFETPASVIARRQAEARPLARDSRPLVMDDLISAPIEEKLLEYMLQGRDLHDALLRDPKRLAAELRVV